MAARRMKLFSDNHITLKKGFKREVIFTPIQKVLPTVQRKPLALDLVCHAIHDYDAGLIRLKAYLVKGFQQPIAGANFKAYYYAIDRTTMDETLAFTSAVIASSNLDQAFVTSVSENDLGEEFLGEFDWAVKVEISRFSRVISKKFYFNQLGIFDFALRIKKKVDFLQITKKGFGE